MIRALMASASGMQAQQMNMDTIANNLANVNTTGFKKSQAMFEDMLYETIRAPGSQQGGTAASPSGVQMGLGTKLVSIAKVYSPGKMQVTNRDLDVAIEGNGFFRVKLPDGTLAYTRDGALSRSSDGKLVTSEGYELDGVDSLSPNATSVAIGPDGTISETVNGTTNQKGSIKLYRFVNPSGLQAQGRNLLTATSASGEAQEGTAGADGFGTLQQGVLETSNVDVVEEMVNLIVAQRAYEVNTKAVQASDEMLQSTNNMKR
jgi:flagellar basal-body rod protein FlgG